MNKLTFFVTVVLVCLICTMPADATIKKLAQTGLQFLKVDVGTRAAALGGAYAMIGQDASAIFYNPSGLARMQTNYEAFLTRTQWIADINYNAGAFAANLGRYGTVGVTFIFADYGDIQGTQVASTEAGYEDTHMLDVGAYAVGVSYAKSLTERFSIGAHVKFAGQNLDKSALSDETIDNSVSGLAFDFGTTFYPGYKSFRLGMYIRNYSPQFKYEKEAFQLPLTFAIGFGMDILDFMGDHENSSLLLGVDALHPRDYTERVHIGMEYSYNKMVFLRGGYKTNYDEEGLTAGVGFHVKTTSVGVKVGYSYSEFGVFDGVNRFDVGFTF
jgi:hypothetical protein